MFRGGSAGWPVVVGNPDFLVPFLKGYHMFAPKSKKPEQSMAPVSAPIPAPEPKMEEQPAPVTEFKNVIARGTIIQGNIVAEGDLFIEGTVRGDVTTKTTLIAGPSCVIEGNIVADHAEVAGQVKGTVQALGLLIIKSSSMIDGDVLTKNLNVESGSTFNGRFTVGSVSTTNGAKKPEAAPAKVDSSVFGSEVRRPAQVPAVPAAPAKI